MDQSRRVTKEEGRSTSSSTLRCSGMIISSVGEFLPFSSHRRNERGRRERDGRRVIVFQRADLRLFSQASIPTRSRRSTFRLPARLHLPRVDMASISSSYLRPLAQNSIRSLDPLDAQDETAEEEGRSRGTVEDLPVGSECEECGEGGRSEGVWLGREVGGVRAL